MTENSRPFISICIPAYKRPDKLRRLLKSISIQTFKNFELVISDDSVDDSVRLVIKEFPLLAVAYYENKRPLGTPANWNYGISKAKGEWIKIMHDDDWFYDEFSLDHFALATSSGKKFILSRYVNIFENGKTERPDFPVSKSKRIVKEPLTLLSDNIIGPPSVSLIHSSIKEQYDERMKWRVDMDLYIRLLSALGSYHLIDKPLIKVGVSDSQVTNSCINVPEVELPEGQLMLDKYGIHPLSNILVYDAWWRILRNNKIRDKQQLFQYGDPSHWPEVIVKMVDLQKMIPASLLKFGVISKMIMSLSYISNQKKLSQNQ